MMAAGDRFRVAPLGGAAATAWYSVCVDGSGRVREWSTAADAVSVLVSAGENLARWQVWRLPAGAIGWRVACLASDAGDVFGVR